MKLSISFEDGVIILDGVARHQISFSEDPNWRTLQWNGEKGWIEVHHGERVWLTEVADVQKFIDMHAAAEPSDLPLSTIPWFITRRQCALQLLAMQVVTPQEALAMTKSAEVPAAVAQVFAGMPEEQRILAEIDFAATNYYRENPLLTMMGLTPEETDQFFIAAAQL